MSDLLTVAEVAELLGIAPDSVTRKFSGVSGVIDIGSAETKKKRRYRILRIPTSVVEKYLRQRGGSVTVPPPERKKPVRANPTEDDIVRQLAAVVNQHGTQAQKTLDRIAERARLLAFVPESRWEEIVWVDDCEE